MLAATTIPILFMLALRAGHVDIPARARAETFLDLLLAPAPTAVRPADTAPHATPRRADHAPAHTQAPRDAPVDDTPSPPAPNSTTPIAPLDLSATTLSRAIDQAARASDSIAARIPSTRLSLADQRAQALQSAKLESCLTPEDQRRHDTSVVHLQGLLALPGLAADLATGGCLAH